MSLLITLEGGEGSGKSTQAERLFTKLRDAAVPVLLTREPGGTPLGEKVTEILKWSKTIPLTPLTELLLFNASRSQLVETVIRPALANGVTVIVDRFSDSTTAYQSYGRGLTLDIVEKINKIATGGLMPDLTILVDVPVATGFGRKKKDIKDRFEEENALFHERVRNGYLQIARSEPARFLVIDGNQSINAIERLIWNRVQDCLAGEKRRN
jgi:dTMP kinase